jgi:putative transposase
MQKQHLKLNDRDRLSLEALLGKTSLTVKIHKRVKALLLLDRGLTFSAVSEQVGLSFPTLKHLLSRYASDSLACLQDLPRSGRPARITGEARAKITALACSKAPAGHSRWSLRLLADKVVELGICQQVSHVQVGEILKKTLYNHILNANGA